MRAAEENLERCQVRIFVPAGAQLRIYREVKYLPESKNYIAKTTSDQMCLPSEIYNLFLFHSIPLISTRFVPVEKLFIRQFVRKHTFYTLITSQTLQWYSEFFS